MAAKRFGIGGSRREFVVSAVPPDATSVLDIGSGEGWTLASVPWAEHRIGVDTDAAIVARARDRYPGIEFHEIGGERLPFGDDAFEVVILSEVIEHVGDDNKQPVIDEAIRVMAPGGQLILTAPHDGVLSLLDPLDAKRRYPALYRLYRRLQPGTPDTPAEIGHKHVTAAEIERLFQGRLTIGTLRYGSPFATLTQALMLLARLLRLPERVLWRTNDLMAWESGLPSPRWLAATMRVVAEKPRAAGQEDVDPLDRVGASSTKSTAGRNHTM